MMYSIWDETSGQWYLESTAFLWHTSKSLSFENPDEAHEKFEQLKKQFPKKNLWLVEWERYNSKR